MMPDLVTALLSLSLAQADAPQETAAEPLTQRQREWAASSCALKGEDIETALASSSIIQGEWFDEPSELSAAIDRVRDKRVIVYGGDYSGKDMRPIASALDGACFTNTDFSKSNWQQTQIADLRFDRVNLAEASMGQVDWPRVKFTGGELARADFTRARLNGAEFVGMYQGIGLEETRFDYAQLSGASFRCGITVDAWCRYGREATFMGADFTGAEIGSLGIWNAAMVRDARFAGTVVSPRQLRYLTDAEIVGELTLVSHFIHSEDSVKEPSATLSRGEVLSLVAALLEDDADLASFDCAKAKTQVEQMICGEYDSQLRALDREMAEVWSRARAAGKGSLTEQRQWLKSRSDCDDRTCLTEKYRRRIAKLYAQLGTQPVLAPDQSITFHSKVLALPHEARKGDIYERIAPVLIDSSWQEVTLTGMEDGTISATGTALGGNAHLCGMDIPDARYDPETGWWKATTETGETFELFRFSEREIQFRYSGNLGNTPVEATDFMSCGARAGFDDGIVLSPIE